MFQIGVLAPRTAVAITHVHGRRLDGNSGAGWNSGVDGSQSGFLQRETCPRFQDNAFIKHAIKYADQVIRIGDKGAHSTKVGCLPEVPWLMILCRLSKTLDTFFMSLRLEAERLLNRCSGTAQRSALSPWMNRAALFFLLLCFFHLHPGFERRQFKIAGASSQRFLHPAPDPRTDDPA